MFKRIIASIMMLSVVQGYAQQWPAIHKETKPWTRWWWMGSAVDKAGLDRQLKSFNEAGFGGVEVVPIYGAIGYEKKYINYLSPQWMKMLDYTVNKTASFNMGVDISVGTGWPIGGPQVSITDAATKMIVQTYTLKAGETLKDKIVLNDDKQKGLPGVFLSTVTAYDENGKSVVITNHVLPDGSLQWQPQMGNWKIFVLFVGKTRQMVKRAAAGGEGYTLDHFSSNASINYFKTFDTAFGNSNHGVRSFFNDSYEVYNADWTADFFNEFVKKRGYDLRPYIKQLVVKSDDEITARVKSDYRETMSDLMLQHFTKKFTDWAHSKKALNTNQAHGSPGNLLDLYAAVDIPESETFGSSAFNIPGLRRDSEDIRNVDPDPNMLKFASSAAHVMGKKFTSNETFTWLTEHFKTSWSQCKPEVEQVFLAGINHVFYHGTTYSPVDATWPGWLFYASVNFVPNNSLWPHLKGLNEYITRCQSVLQSGEPDNEVLAYWPVYDSWSATEGLDMPFQVHDIDVWLHPTAFYKNLTRLQRQGYSFDFSSDRMLKEASVENGNIKISLKGAAYKTLLVSSCKYMPVSTFEQILRLAKEGAVIVLQQFPEDVPGLGNLESNRKRLKELMTSVAAVQKTNGIKEAFVGKGRIIITGDVEEALKFVKINRETLTDQGLKFTRRRINNGKYYYIVNHTPKIINDWISLNARAEAIVLMDPQTGETGLTSFRRQENNVQVKLQLQPGEAMIVKATHSVANTKRWHYLSAQQNAIVLNNDWKLHFTDGGPFIPVDRTMKRLQPWTRFTEDSTTQYFSGSAVYSTSFQLNTKTADDYFLQLDQLYESAKIKINGKDAGIIWSIPFKLKIGQYLKAGKNTIEIEVCNLMANRIRYMDRHRLEWRKYHEINFVNINYKNFDASDWKVQPSGLGGAVRIIPVNYSK
ncbi:MAG: glycoside hydrolase [Sediminibacterium magnilacihabitans]|jgi:alpha-L-rhamnosidase|nr:glycoside hydrolase [Sediminibacterium magnilacihabitans]PQV58115.1 alpha-L-rhamnosidase-like protein [Sediminibacterium magnilacihabitans]